MKTVKLGRDKNKILTSLQIMKGDVPEEMKKAVLIGTGFVGQEFLKNATSKYYPCEFTLVMDSKGALSCKDGIKNDEVPYILQTERNKKINLNEVHIPGKKTKFYKVPGDRNKIDMLEGLDEFSQLIVVTPSSYPQTEINRKYVDIAVNNYKANVVTATKNIFNGNRFFRKTMKGLKDNKRYAAFNAACGVESLIPTILSPHSGDIYRIDTILNASTNMYIKLVEERYTPEQAIDKLVAYGSLEPGGKIGDEADDVRRKLGNLANVIQYKLPEGAEITQPLEIDFDEKLIAKWVNDAKANGKKVKLVAALWTERDGNKIYIKSEIAPREISDNDPLAQINGLDCGFAHYIGENVNPTVRYGTGAGNITGKVVYADSVTVHNLMARDLLDNTYTGPMIDLENYSKKALLL